ncbi:MAG: hypothetical protein NTZ42_00170 [Candidatus Gribaldobacteria bacterium]|nr:hypothetical protein [Candidatus Gribaldobacteria bacterium]
MKQKITLLPIKKIVALIIFAVIAGGIPMLFAERVQLDAIDSPSLSLIFTYEVIAT